MSQTRSFLLVATLVPWITDALITNATIGEHEDVVPLTRQQWNDDQVLAALFARQPTFTYGYADPQRLPAYTGGQLTAQQRSDDEVLARIMNSHRVEATTSGMLTVDPSYQQQLFPYTGIDEGLDYLAQTQEHHPYIKIEHIIANDDDSVRVVAEILVDKKVQKTDTTITAEAIAKISGSAQATMNAGELTEFLVNGNLAVGASAKGSVGANGAMASLTMLVTADVEAKFPNIDNVGMSGHAEAGARADLAATFDFSQAAVHMKMKVGGSAFVGAQAKATLNLRWFNIHAKAKVGAGADCILQLKDGVAGVEFGAALGPGAGVGVDVCYGQIITDVARVGHYAVQGGQAFGKGMLYLGAFGGCMTSTHAWDAVQNNVAKLGSYFNVLR